MTDEEKLLKKVSIGNILNNIKNKYRNQTKKIWKI